MCGKIETNSKREQSGRLCEGLWSFLSLVEEAGGPGWGVTENPRGKVSDLITFSAQEAQG